MLPIEVQCLSRGLYLGIRWVDVPSSLFKVMTFRHVWAGLIRAVAQFIPEHPQRVTGQVHHLIVPEFGGIPARYAVPDRELAVGVQLVFWIA